MSMVRVVLVILPICLTERSFIVSAALSFASRVIENADGGRKRLAVVTFTHHGERLVISLAKRQAIVNSANTVFAFKHRIGRNSANTVFAFKRYIDRKVISLAKRQAIVNSANTVFAFKHRIGRNLANTVFAFKRHIDRKFEVKEVQRKCRCQWTLLMRVRQ
jgi:molecular chaperone DnaK (HSP70)